MLVNSSISTFNGALSYLISFLQGNHDGGEHVKTRATTTGRPVLKNASMSSTFEAKNIARRKVYLAALFL